jgi:hypothetical protein
VSRESSRPAGLAIILLTVLVTVVALAGCAGSPPESYDNQSRTAYLEAYASGIEQHAVGQSFFNNGTRAWEAIDLRTAIADYSNASMIYSEAAKDYGNMAQYAQNKEETVFADSLRGCAFNLSQASDLFVNAAIALGQNNSDTAYDWFCQGQSHVDASEALLNWSIATTPKWLIELASG